MKNVGIFEISLHFRYIEKYFVTVRKNTSETQKIGHGGARANPMKFLYARGDVPNVTSGQTSRHGNVSLCVTKILLKS